MGRDVSALPEVARANEQWMAEMLPLYVARGVLDVKTVECRTGTRFTELMLNHRQEFCKSIYLLFGTFSTLSVLPISV
jgi:hypothetical protein